MITPNFARSEFACPCGCTLSAPHPVLVVGLQRLRDIIRHPIVITSGSRCPVHNKAVGGSPHSLHMQHRDFDGYTMAADVYVKGYPLVQLHDIAQALDAYGPGGIGVYVDETPRLHLDVRGAAGQFRPARWAEVDGEATTVAHAMNVDLERRGMA